MRLKVTRPRPNTSRWKRVEGISSINEPQAQELESLKIKKPTQNAQMTLL